MSMSAEAELATILNRIEAGDSKAVGELYPVVYDELRRKAQHLMSQERPNHTLQPTALVNEAFVKMAGGARAKWQSQRHFYNAAAEAMRKILVDHARAKAAQKRGGDRARVNIDDVNLKKYEDSSRFVALDAALEKLQKIDERQYWVVMYTYFSGLQDEQIARMLGVSSKTVQRDWNAAKAFLVTELK
jgi:RNA polymerase sigma-70 factor (ECF subfamily)